MFCVFRLDFVASWVCFANEKLFVRSFFSEKAVFVVADCACEGVCLFYFQRKTCVYSFFCVTFANYNCELAQWGGAETFRILALLVCVGIYYHHEFSIIQTKNL